MPRFVKKVPQEPVTPKAIAILGHTGFELLHHEFFEGSPYLKISVLTTRKELAAALRHDDDEPPTTVALHLTDGTRIIGEDVQIGKPHWSCGKIASLQLIGSPGSINLNPPLVDEPVFI